MRSADARQMRGRCAADALRMRNGPLSCVLDAPWMRARDPQDARWMRGECAVDAPRTQWMCCGCAMDALMRHRCPMDARIFGCAIEGRWAMPHGCPSRIHWASVGHPQCSDFRMPAKGWVGGRTCQLNSVFPKIIAHVHSTAFTGK